MTSAFRDRQLAFREGEILRTARAVLDEVGCRRLTMGEVAARLGVSKGTLYVHFESRDELLRRLVEEGWAGVVEGARRLEGRPPTDRRPAQIVGLLVRCFLGLDGEPPCCLEEIECPFLDAGSLEAPVRTLRGAGPGGLGLAATARVLAAAVRARRRAEGSAPTEGDAVAIVAFLLGADGRADGGVGG
ncbi:MAG: hypothetical protein KatS3mg014_0900 [Actinomycetota bacterium]|nr:MAG: hypothetical protein KatS3mg014_0900 [Actinomycetota bacterium]